LIYLNGILPYNSVVVH